MDYVYNVVLSAGHVIVINDLQFITLGHGIDSHPVLSHAFFGTQVSSCLSVCFHQAHDARARPLCARCFRGTKAKVLSRSAASSGMQSSVEHTRHTQHHSLAGIATGLSAASVTTRSRRARGLLTI